MKARLLWELREVAGQHRGMLVARILHHRGWNFCASYGRLNHLGWAVNFAQARIEGNS